MTRRVPGRSPARSSGHTVTGWLGHDQRAANVMAMAQYHLRLEQALAQLLPTGFGADIRIARVDAQQLVLAVPGPAHAAKLRQMAPSLAQKLQAGGWQVGEIRVQVQAGLTAVLHPASRPPKSVTPLGPQALDAFQQLHDHLQPGELADAVARLLAHHGTGNKT